MPRLTSSYLHESRAAYPAAPAPRAGVAESVVTLATPTRERRDDGQAGEPVATLGSRIVEASRSWRVEAPLRLAHTGERLIGIDSSGIVYAARLGADRFARCGVLSDFVARCATTCLFADKDIVAVGYRTGTSGRGGVRLVHPRALVTNDSPNDGLPTFNWLQSRQKAVVAIARRGAALAFLADNTVDLVCLSASTGRLPGRPTPLQRLHISPWGPMSHLLGLGGVGRNWTMMATHGNALAVVIPGNSREGSLRELFPATSSVPRESVDLQDRRPVALVSGAHGAWLATDDGDILRLQAATGRLSLRFRATAVGALTCLAAGHGWVVAGGTQGAQAWSSERRVPGVRLRTDEAVSEVAIGPGGQVFTYGLLLGDAQGRSRALRRFSLGAA